MKAFVLDNGLQEVELDAPRQDDEVKVKVSLCAITHSDIALLSSMTQSRIVPGRIAVGLISEAPQDSGLTKGTRVLISPYINGKTRGVDTDGYLREYATVPLDCVLPLPEEVRDKDAIFAEYIALGLRAIDTLLVEEGEYVTILGADPLCLLLAQLVGYYHAIPIVCSDNEEGLQLALDMGITYCINTRIGDAVSRVRDITGGAMSDCTILNALTLPAAYMGIGVTKNKGRICVVGTDTFVDNLPIDMKEILSRHLTIHGITAGGRRNIPASINLIATEAVFPDFFACKTFAFEEAQQVLTDLARMNPQFNGFWLCKID